MLATTQDWIAHLRAQAAARVPGGAGDAAFLDTRAPDLLGLPPAVLTGPGPDGPLWRATQDPCSDPDALLGARPGSSLADLGAFRTIEVWTECELSALHALWRLCRLHPTPLRRARLAELCAWHLEHTQPDNATNRPWALHAFVAAGDPESLLYAETLLHNVAASEARREPLTRWILLDSAQELELHLAAIG